ncbi:hypothetical protein [Streptomyces sp. NPDC047042]|uniref:hypothetical protein n=1 Tax=Streptomyces sp. NPDC047042 TaxID=3154807 RepID=UPI0033D2402D
MGIRTLIRWAARARRPASVRAFAGDASTVRLPDGSPGAMPLAYRADALRRLLAQPARIRRAHRGTRSGLSAAGRALAWRRWAGWGRGWLRRPLRGDQREPVRPPARPPA